MDAKAAAVWADPDTYATCLVLLGLDRYGRPGAPPDESPLHWAPDTWRQEVRDDTGAALPQRNVDRLGAACLLVTTPREFFESARGFNDVVLGLAAAYFEPLVWHPPGADETLWGLVEAHLLLGAAEGEYAFGPEVVGYANRIVREAGFVALPGVFPMFGIPRDPKVWDDLKLDYPDEPDLALAVAQSAGDRERDLDLDTVDRLRDLAARLAALPLSDPKADRSVVGELDALAAQIELEARRKYPD